MTKIVFLDRATLPDEIHLRAFGFPHELAVFAHTAPDEVAARIADADIVIANKTPLRANALAAATRLKMVAIAATGTDIVDVGACSERGIVVSNIRNYAIHTVPEQTFALVLALRRSIVPYDASVARGRWWDSGQFCYFDFPIRALAGATLGIIGDGVLGRAVGDIGRAFGMTVLFSDYKGTSGMGPLYTPFDEVLRLSDVITLHAPLTPASRNLIGVPEFARMERRPLIINTARGGLVDEEALIAALDSGQVSGAGFDVATTEPPPPGHPILRLAGRPNVILTPHVAWASREAIQTLADQLVDNVEAFMRGAARNVVIGA